MSDTLLDQIRGLGWAVAVHNDYRLQGVAHTFYLFTHPSRLWVKGEGNTDEEALQQVLADIEALSNQTTLLTLNPPQTFSVTSAAHDLREALLQIDVQKVKPGLLIGTSQLPALQSNLAMISLFDRVFAAFEMAEKARETFSIANSRVSEIPTDRLPNDDENQLFEIEREARETWRDARLHFMDLLTQYREIRAGRAFTPST